jgi:hypothetical protein
MLNAMTGVKYNMSNSRVYDFVEFNDTVKIITKDDYIPTSDDHIINIQVSSDSYLKYVAMCLSRTSGLDIVLESLPIDTFKKLEQHCIFSHFLPSLSTISGRLSGNVDIKYLREWARLALFANKGITISQWMLPDVVVDAEHNVDFESFYDGTLVDTCREILARYQLSISLDQVENLLDHFNQNNRYRQIDAEVPTILENIKLGKSYPIRNTNFLSQAYIDNWLVENYQINPLLRNEYFTDTQQITETYGLLNKSNLAT